MRSLVHRNERAGSHHFGRRTVCNTILKKMGLIMVIMSDSGNQGENPNGFRHQQKPLRTDQSGREYPTNGGTQPMKWPNSPASRRSSSEAGRAGCAGATSARSSCARASTSMRQNQSGIRSGRGPTTTSSARGARAIRRRCEPEPSSGSESSTGVGRRARLTTR